MDHHEEEAPQRENMQQHRSYKDSVLGRQGGSHATDEDLYSDGNISDDDIIKESNEDSWFGTGMTKEEKIEARKPWRNSVIVKLVGCTIGYHYLW